MNTHPPNRSAVVADARSLMRDLLRFLLEQEGFAIASEASTGAAAVDAVAEHHPDVVVLHEAVALEAPDVIERLRAGSPDPMVVVLTTDRERTPPSLVTAADAVVEEGAGLQDLAVVLAAGAGAISTGWTPRPAPPYAKDERSRRWMERLQGAVAASILILGIVFAANVEVPPPDRPAPATEVAERWRLAWASLATLAEQLPEATPQEVVTLASQIVEQHALLLAAGSDVTPLEDEIAEVLFPMIAELSPDVAVALRDVLGDLLIEPTPSPGVSASPEPPTENGATEPEPPESEAGPSGEPPAPPPTEPPPPSEEPSPTPTQTEPTPTDTETPSPSPTQTEAPSPSPSGTETPSPSPSGTETPSPSPSESPSPSPTQSPSPTATETPSPTPSETTSPTPSPSGTETSSPSESPSPSPTESPSPSATETPPPTSTEPPTASASPTTDRNVTEPRDGNGMIVVLPPGLVLLLGSSGAARWLRRRHR